ncbi:LysR family transcriptional regulator [Vibrio inusitatus NBRC 102082]|uniref:LysR family transcriptional regulator n=1 Tax=Vibrio inusitatus NBRC 102082 TaxID=1219070 RepID=A0A4Y3HU37_9VIBR|nr:LysR family transcriptional regulator [Vibrio inusitatus]GEA50481.1 LysR family transcriptional regulator [Vibrio inusitatus NBRC 102082]
MAKDRFANLDLNLLRTFLVLSQELNMRKASTRLHVSQPAISQSLQKLRHHFDDQLFVKVRSGLEPTPYTLELANSITPFFDGLAEAINGIGEFSPLEVEQTLNIGMIPTVETALVGRLYHALKQAAPKASLGIKSWSQDSINQLITGQSLLAVAYESSLSKEIYSEKLIEIQGMLVARKGHPLAGKSCQLAELEGAQLATFATAGWNDNYSYAQEFLKKYGINVEIGFRSELIMPVIDITHRTNMLLPHSDLFPFKQFTNLVPLDIDIDNIEKGSNITLYAHYHVKYRNSPLINWLVRLIRQELQNQIEDNHCLLRR